jgi:hypothetical protein
MMTVSPVAGTVSSLNRTYVTGVDDRGIAPDQILEV